jgi:hypothetical protein
MSPGISNYFPFNQRLRPFNQSDPGRPYAAVYLDVQAYAYEKNSKGIFRLLI